MAASEATVHQICNLIEDMIYLDRNKDVWIKRIREIKGNKSVMMTLDAVATELQKRWA